RGGGERHRRTAGALGRGRASTGRDALTPSGGAGGASLSHREEPWPGGDAHYGQETFTRRALRGDRPHAFGRSNYGRGPRPGGAADGGGIGMKSIDQNNIPHEFAGEELESVLVTDGSGQALPGIIIIPTVMGVTDLEIGF